MSQHTKCCASSVFDGQNTALLLVLNQLHKYFEHKMNYKLDMEILLHFLHTWVTILTILYSVTSPSQA